jgi:membrane protease YdiL (CAAX protease family)
MSLVSLVLANFILAINSGIRVPGSLYPFIFVLSGLFMLWVVAKNWKNIPEVDWRGVYHGVILTALVLIPATYISYLSQKGNPVTPIDFLGVIIKTTMPTFALIAVSEEILFRGFLWGYLKQIGLNSNTALILQGIIFWLIHIINLSFLPAFLICIPLMTIILSILAKQTKQLFPSIISHTMYDVLVGLVWRLFV